MPASGIAIHADCQQAFQEFTPHNSPLKYIIYKISDDLKQVEVDEIGSEQDYEVFRQKLLDAKGKDGQSRPSLAVYKVDFVLQEGNGKRSKIAFISYIDDSHSKEYRTIYASSQEGLKMALGSSISMNWRAHDAGDLEWTEILKEASGGQKTI